MLSSKRKEGRAGGKEGKQGGRPGKILGSQSLRQLCRALANNGTHLSLLPRGTTADSWPGNRYVAQTDLQFHNLLPQPPGY